MLCPPHSQPSSRMDSPSEQGVTPLKTNTPSAPSNLGLPDTTHDSVRRIDDETARQMLLIDFEQAFVIHNEYKDSERDLYKLSLKILAFPLVIIGAILSAGLISSVPEAIDVLKLPFIWFAFLAAGILNVIVVRAYVVTDRVQTEAKHQVNRLRTLYLHALQDRFPPGWEPVWGATNPYLDTRWKLRAAFLTPLVLGALNAIYVGCATDRLLVYQAGVAWHFGGAIGLAVCFYLLQLEVTWNILRSKLRKKQR